MSRSTIEEKLKRNDLLTISSALPQTSLVNFMVAQTSETNLTAASLLMKFADFGQLEKLKSMAKRFVRSDAINLKSIQNLEHLVVILNREFYPFLKIELFSHKAQIYCCFFPSLGEHSNYRYIERLALMIIMCCYKSMSGKMLDPTLYLKQVRECDHYELQEFLTYDLKYDSPRTTLVLKGELFYQALNREYVTKPEYHLSGVEQPPSFMQAVVSVLAENIKQVPSLEETARQFCMSASTFKRHLRQHNTSYNNEVDNLRRDMALYLIYFKNYSNTAVSQQLNFHDKNNFRRSFKRWMGVLPSRYSNTAC